MLLNILDFQTALSY